MSKVSTEYLDHAEGIARRKVLEELKKWAKKDKFQKEHNEWEEGYNKALEFTIKKCEELKNK